MYVMTSVQYRMQSYLSCTHKCFSYSTCVNNSEHQLTRNSPALRSMRLLVLPPTFENKLPLDVNATQIHTLKYYCESVQSVFCVYAYKPAA